VPLLVVADFTNARRINALLAQLAPDLRLRLLELAPEAPLGLLAVQEAIGRGELVALLADRATQRPGRDVTATFLGAPAAFPIGPWVLAHALGCPVAFVTALATTPTRYDVYCVPMADVVKLPRATRREAAGEWAQRYAALLEDFTRRAPLNWFNFFPFWSDA
jgi:predicted LPLAT superfamily acyltransferase